MEPPDSPDMDSIQLQHTRTLIITDDPGMTQLIYDDDHDGDDDRCATSSENEHWTNEHSEVDED